MRNELFKRDRKIKHENIQKYKVPPSFELIDEVIKKSYLKFVARFSFVYGIPKDVITWYTTGQKPLSPKYWHIFYDFDNINLRKKANRIKVQEKIEQELTAPLPVSKSKSIIKEEAKKKVLISNKNILDGFGK